MKCLFFCNLCYTWLFFDLIKVLGYLNKFELQLEQSFTLLQITLMVNWIKNAQIYLENKMISLLSTLKMVEKLQSSLIVEQNLVTKFSMSLYLPKVKNNSFITLFSNLKLQSMKFFSKKYHFLKAFMWSLISEWAWPSTIRRWVNHDFLFSIV